MRATNTPQAGHVRRFMNYQLIGPSLMDIRNMTHDQPQSSHNPYDSPWPFYFRSYILALACQGSTRLRPLDQQPGYYFLMISFLYCSCWFICSHNPLLFRDLYQHSHTPFCSFTFGICFSFWGYWDYLTGDASGPLPLYILVVVSDWVSLVLLSQEFLYPSSPQCD